MDTDIAFAAHPIGALFASLQLELDHDGADRERLTPAGAIWQVEGVKRYECDRGSACAYTLGCAATGALITAYTPIAGVPYGHIRDEMADFLPITLPSQTWLTLLRQLRAGRRAQDAMTDIATAMKELDDALNDEHQENGPQSPDAESYNELLSRISAELHKAADGTTP